MRRSQKWIALLLVAVVAIVCVAAANAPSSPTSQPADGAGDAAAAIDAGKLPAGYRDWRLISVAREEGDLDDIRAVLGNDVAVKAYREGSTSSYPDGTIITRLAWSFDASEENNKTFGRRQSFVAGHPKNGVHSWSKARRSTRRPAAGATRNSTTGSP
jgi:hypothetical protein